MNWASKLKEIHASWVSQSKNMTITIEFEKRKIIDEIEF